MNSNKWESQDTNSFWAGMKELDHVIHPYDDDRCLIESLIGFTSSCLHSDIAVVVIASEAHLDLLGRNLRADGFDIFSQTISGRYLPVNAKEILNQFMFNGVPDKGLFNYFLSSFSLRAQRLKKKIRVFSELAGILHGDGNHQAAEVLEEFWEQHRAITPFCFFRACRAVDLVEFNGENLGSRYSFILSDKTSRDTVWFQRIN
jgi:hypothetical protein